MASGPAQTKYLQGGSGFLSQHSKELFFGTGSHHGVVTARVRWPSGLSQEFPGLPQGHQIWLEEGVSTFQANPFLAPRLNPPSSLSATSRELLPLESNTWLVQPLKAPGFKLTDLDGIEHTLDSWQGHRLLLTLWSTNAQESLRQLDDVKMKASTLEHSRLHVIAINLDESSQISEARRLAAKYRSYLTVLFATEEFAGIYNILYRHLFDRRRDLPIPASLLIDSNGMIVKVYQGFADTLQIADDGKSMPENDQDRLRLALPFAGLLAQDTFERNDFTYGVALYQHGFLDQAAESFQRVIASKPNNANAYYNLGTLNLRRNRTEDAVLNLQKTVELRPDFAEAWNNLGMIAAQQGNSEEAIRDFQRSISIRPTYFTAHLNLGNVYRHQREFDKAEQSLSLALSMRPDDPEIHYSLGMLFAQQDDFQRASEYLGRAIALRPDYPEALNNLGVLYVKRKDYSKAEEHFLSAVKVAPTYDQPYLNLARLYAMQNDRQKARDVLQKLLQVQPKNASAEQALEVLQ
jgi:tetratricopeptide (TPR) repeat protein